jgi:hypothetical protein
MERFAEGIAEVELARVSPNVYWKMKRTEMIFGGVIFATFVGLFALAVFTGMKQTENKNLKAENKRLKEGK